MPTNDETGDRTTNRPTSTRQPDGPQGTVGATPEQIDSQARSAAGRFPAVPGYAFQRQLGEGGMAVVYAAREVALARDVAIKVMKPGHSANRFVVESQITAQLPHPNIPPVHALGALADGRPYLVMKLVSGLTLGDALKGAEPGDRLRMLGHFEGICQAVGFAHARGLIHRDLKPSNVMVGAFGEVQVMDWGLAKDAGGPDAADADAPRVAAATMATMAGAVKGTPAYMAPEQARGEKVDARADVFALGGILATMLTGKPPFVGNSVMDTVIRAAQAELSDIFKRLSASGADRELIAVAKRCLAPRAQDRPANGNAVAKAVAAYRTKVEERLRRAERERAAAEARETEEANTRREAEAKAAEQRKRRRAQWALAASVLLLAAAAAFGVTIASLWRKAEANHKEAVTQRDAAHTAKNDALTQKGVADTRRNEAEQAKGEALKQKAIAEQAKANEAVERGKAELAREKFERLDHGRTMLVAHQEWRDNNLVAMRALLDGTNPEFRGWEWCYLDKLCKGSLLTLMGHTDVVRASAFSPDGARVVTASADNTAKVWDANTGAEVRTLKGHTNTVGAVAFSPDGARIVTGSSDNTAKVWDARPLCESITPKPKGMPKR